MPYPLTDSAPTNIDIPLDKEDTKDEEGVKEEGMFYLYLNYIFSTLVYLNVLYIKWLFSLKAAFISRF